MQLNVKVWQVLAFWAITVLGAQLPMYVLAASIDNDEHAKASLGWLLSAVFLTLAAGVLFVMATGRFPSWLGGGKINAGERDNDAAERDREGTG